MVERSPAVDGCTPPPDATPQPDGSWIHKFPNGSVFRYHQDNAGNWQQPTALAPALEPSSDLQATTTVPTGKEDEVAAGVASAVEAAKPSLRLLIAPQDQNALRGCKQRSPSAYACAAKPEP